MENTLIKLTLHDETKKRAHDSQKVPLFRKADWPTFKSLIKDYQQKFMNNHLGRSVVEFWNDFTSTLGTFSSQCIPVKLFGERNHCLGLIKQLDVKLNKEIANTNNLRKLQTSKLVLFVCFV